MARTQALLDRLCDELTRNCGDDFAAARSCGVSLGFINQWRKDDKVTDEAIREAMAVGTAGLVSSAISKAINGVQEDVYHRGIVVGQKTVYSDTLHALLLKAKVNDFKGSDAAAPQVTVNIANMMPRANSYEEWLAMRDMTNAPKLLASTAENDAIDAIFTVEEPAFAPSSEVIDAPFTVKVRNPDGVGFAERTLPNANPFARPFAGIEL